MTPPTTETRIRQAYDSGSVALAAGLASQYLRRDPGNPVVLLLLAQASEDLGRYDEARAAYDRFAEMVGGHSRASCCQRGALEERAGNFPDAEQWYRRAIDAARNDTGGYIALGAMHAGLGHLAEAATIHREGTKCSEGNVDEAWLNLGLVLRALGQYAEAIRCFEAALELTPDYSEARRARVDAMQASSLLDEA